MEDYKKHLIKQLCDSYKDTHAKVYQEELAQLIGISKSTLDKACVGDVVPAIDTLYKVAKFFDLTLNDFFTSFEKSKSMVVTSPIPEYSTANESEGWKAAFKAQTELIQLQKDYTELAVEHERTKKEYVTDNAAKAG
jgi:DNA-binding XRE family transcriptional regulator